VWSPSIASILQKIQLEFKQIQQVMLIGRHTSPLDTEVGSQNATWVAMIVVTRFRDLNHKPRLGRWDASVSMWITVTASGASTARPPFST
jgi:hypothetical protein